MINFKNFTKERETIYIFSLSMSLTFIYILSLLHSIDSMVENPLKKTFYYLIVAALYCSFFEDTFARMNPLEAALKQRRLLDQHLNRNI